MPVCVWNIWLGFVSRVELCDCHLLFTNRIRFEFRLSGLCLCVYLYMPALFLRCTSIDCYCYAWRRSIMTNYLLIKSLSRDMCFVSEKKYRLALGSNCLVLIKEGNIFGIPKRSNRCKYFDQTISLLIWTFVDCARRVEDRSFAFVFVYEFGH